MSVATADWVGVTLSGGRYRITGKLGEGGMGLVYRAWDENVGHDVVIKVPRRSMMDEPGFAARFKDEIRSLIKLPHPHIVKVFDVGEHDGLPFAVMQFLPGGSLEDRAYDREGKPRPMPPATLASWLPQVSKALQFMHGEKYVHRDVKPANILFDAQGNAYLSDFGVHKALAGGEAQAKVKTGTGMVLGTPHYMAPELAQGEAVDGRIDQYALAVTVHEVLSGRKPFDGPTGLAIMFAHVNQPPPRLDAILPAIPRPLADAVLRGLEKDPTKRYKTCTAFAADVLNAARGSAAQPRPTGGAAVEGVVGASPSTASKALQGTQPALRPAGQTKVMAAGGSGPALAPGGDLLRPRGTQARSAIPPQASSVGDGKSKNHSGRLVVGLAFAALALIIGFWAFVVFRVRTANGTLVVQVNEPGAELYVDGERVTVDWQNGGLKAEVGVKPGTRTVELKKEGFRAYGEEVLLEDRGRTVLVARLEPNPANLPVKPPISVPVERPPQNVPVQSAQSVNNPETPPTVPADAQVFEGHWYKFYPERVSWKAARDRCLSYGGRLVIINSLPENAFVGGLVEKADRQDCWIGATDEAETGNWRNADGEILQFTNWFAGQPNNKNGEEHYALISNRVRNPTAWQWCDQSNEPMDHEPGFVCEWESKSSPSPDAAALAGEPVTLPGDRPRPLRNPFQEPASIPQAATPGAPLGSAPQPIASDPSGDPPAVVGERPQPLDCTSAEGVSAEQVRQAQQAWARYLGREVEAKVELANGVAITFVLVPPGKFQMGSPSGEMGKGGRYPNETLHEVTLTEPFDLGKFEVTQAEYAAVTGNNQSGFQGPERPVEVVTWNEADAFGRVITNKLSDKHVYRLPTEAEWEYACRGGRPTSQSFGVGDGRILTTQDANIDNAFRETCKVGSYAPNALGLHDMHGNVWEWCADWNEPYPQGPVTNPLRTVGGPFRVARGGCWNEPAPECRSALRQGSPEARRDVYIGFRLARTIPLPPVSADDAPAEATTVDTSPEPPMVTSLLGKRAGDTRDDNSLKMKFCWCPAGKTRGFWMGKYEVTQGEWRALMGSLPPYLNKGNGDRFPIYNVSLDEATEFCRKLTSVERKAGRLPQGWSYRIPTEEDWEYACRAGTTTATAFGNNLSSMQANFNGDWPHGAAPKGPNLQQAVEVGSYPPNAWGLCDMHGNVKEFTTTPGHVRGGSWFDSGRNCCSEIFIPDPPSALESLGFRVARVPSLELKRMGRRP